MNVLLDAAQITEGSSAGTAPVRPKQAKGDSAPAKVISENSKPSVPAGLLQANVTFRRDSGGQIYYVITDAQTGKELREFPAAEVRKVGQGIEEFLKQEQKKATPPLEIKA